MSSTKDLIIEKCNAVRDLLIAKNESYGDSALHPICVFGRGRASDQLRARIDDKLSRIRNAPDAFGEDVIKDLIGYLVMLQIAMDEEGKKP